MSQDGAFHSLTVLVVEDEAFSAQIIARVLNKIGVSQVLLAGNGTEAIQQMEDPDVCIDLVISDIEMPEMDGYELVRRIRYGVVPRYKALPVLILTGKDTEKNIQKAKFHRINGYVIKPPEVEKLKAHMKSALGY